MTEYFHCACENPKYEFNCVCTHVKDNPGDIEFTCEFCGIYNASKPICSRCESGNDYPKDIY